MQIRIHRTNYILSLSLSFSFSLCESGENCQSNAIIRSEETSKAAATLEPYSKALPLKSTQTEPNRGHIYVASISYIKCDAWLQNIIHVRINEIERTQTSSLSLTHPVSLLARVCV